ncbi:hypothetical protein ABT023_03020 [Micromonospora sp. NPDC002296]
MNPGGPGPDGAPPPVLEAVGEFSVVVLGPPAVLDKSDIDQFQF